MDSFFLNGGLIILIATFVLKSFFSKEADRIKLKYLWITLISTGLFVFCFFVPLKDYELTSRIIRSLVLVVMALLLGFLLAKFTKNHNYDED